MKKRFLLFSLLGIAILSAPFSAALAQQSENAAEPIVTIVKYSDYQCPACAYFHPFTLKLKEDFGDKVKVVYKNFPLNSHQYAQITARAAEAARKQGKHQEMHNKLFEEQAAWSRGNVQLLLIGYATEIGLDVTQFKRDLNSSEMQRIIMEDKAEGQRLGANATPTFFINGDKLERNPSSYEVFKSLVESYMRKS